MLTWCREELARLGRAGGRRASADAATTPAEAWALGPAWTADDELICITGSVFIAAELRALATAAATAAQRQLEADASAARPAHTRQAARNGEHGESFRDGDMRDAPSCERRGAGRSHSVRESIRVIREAVAELHSDW